MRATDEAWVLVPRKPTEEMIAAGWIDKEDVDPDDIWAAMLSAAPSAPAGNRPEQPGVQPGTPLPQDGGVWRRNPAPDASPPRSPSGDYRIMQTGDFAPAGDRTDHTRRLRELSAWLSEHNIDMQMPEGMIDPAEAADLLASQAKAEPVAWMLRNGYPVKSREPANDGRWLVHAHCTNRVPPDFPNGWDFHFTVEADGTFAANHDYDVIASPPAGSESAESTKLRAALRPFVEFLSDVQDDTPGDFDGEITLLEGPPPLYQRITMADFRRARAALASTAGRSPEEKEKMGK